MQNLTGADAYERGTKEDHPTEGKAAVLTRKTKAELCKTSVPVPCHYRDIFFAGLPFRDAAHEIMGLDLWSEHQRIGLG